MIAITTKSSIRVNAFLEFSLVFIAKGRRQIPPPLGKSTLFPRKPACAWPSADIAF